MEKLTWKDRLAGYCINVSSILFMVGKRYQGLARSFGFAWTSFENCFFFPPFFPSSVLSLVWPDLFRRLRRHHLPHHRVGPDGHEPRPGDQIQRPGDGDGHGGHHQPGGHPDPGRDLRQRGAVADGARYANQKSGKINNRLSARSVGGTV